MTTLVLTEEQRLIKESALQFFRDHGGARRLRQRRDAGDLTTPGLWSEVAALGWLGMAIPEADGGAGLGLAELALVLEAAGRALAPEPLVGHALAVDVIARAGSEAQRAAWLPRLVAGEARAALAWDEQRARGDVERIAALIEPDGEGWRVTGDKVDVLGGPGADVLVVVARRADLVDRPCALALVDPRAPGVALTPLSRIDSLPAARVALDGARVDGDVLMPRPEALVPALDRGAVALASELLGTATQAFDLTLAYLRERQQFGVAIGTFQVLRHRAARMYIALELARSSVMAAARALDAAGPAGHDAGVGQVVSLAKAMTNDAALLVADEAIQMHGGIGMTDEHDIGLYAKRVRVSAMTLGDAALHRDRWARLGGY